MARPPAPGSSRKPHPIGARREPHPFAGPCGLPPAVVTPRSISVGPRPSLPAGGAATPRPPSCSSSDSNRSGGGRMAGGLSAPQARRGSGRAPAQARGPRRRSRCRGGHGVRRARLFPSGGGRESRSAAAPGPPHPPRSLARGSLPSAGDFPRRSQPPPLATLLGTASRTSSIRSAPRGPGRASAEAEPRPTEACLGLHRGGAEMEPLQMPTFGALAALWKRPRSTPGQRGPRAQLGAP